MGATQVEGMYHLGSLSDLICIFRIPPSTQCECKYFSNPPCVFVVKTVVLAVVEPVYNNLKKKKCNWKIHQKELVKNKRNLLKIECNEYKYQGKCVSGSEVANAFANYFKTVFLTDTPTLSVEAVQHMSHGTPIIPCIAIDKIILNYLYFCNEPCL